MIFRSGVLFFALVVWVGGAEIVAWKIPLNCFSARGLQSGGLVKCEKFPEASPFFKEGDEVWDLAEIPDEETIFRPSAFFWKDYTGNGPSTNAGRAPIEWLVWNATSGRIVAKSNWGGIWQIDELMKAHDPRRVVRTNFDVYSVPADGSPLSKNAVPVLSLAARSHSGEEFEISKQAGKHRLDVAATTTDGGDLVEHRFDLRFSPEGDRPIEVVTSVICAMDQSIWLARDFDGRKGWDIRVSSGIELWDGSPLKDRTLIQKGQISEPVVIGKFYDDELSQKMLTLPDGGTLVIGKLSLSSEFNPLSGGAFPGISEYSYIDPPAILKSWAEHPLVDISTLLKKTGLNFTDGRDFAGYDPVSARAMIYFKDRNETEKLEVLNPRRGHLPKLMATTIENHGEIRLLGLAGQNSRLSRLSLDQARDVPGEFERTVVVQPFLKGGGTVGTHLDFSDSAGSGEKSSPIQSVTGEAGKFLEIVLDPLGEKHSKIRVKTEILDPFSGH